MCSTSALRVVWQKGSGRSLLPSGRKVSERDEGRGGDGKVHVQSYVSLENSNDDDGNDYHNRT